VLTENIKKILFDKIYYTKGERKAAVGAIKDQLDEYLSAQNLSSEKRHFIAKKLVEKMIDTEITRAIVEDKR
jgi:hypothetical protein